MTISEANMLEAKRLARISRGGSHAVYNRDGKPLGVFEIAAALQAKDDAAKISSHTPTVDIDKLAEEISFKLLAEVHHDGYFASHDEGSTFISIIKTALLKAAAKEFHGNFAKLNSILEAKE